MLRAVAVAGNSTVYPLGAARIRVKAEAVDVGAKNPDAYTTPDPPHSVARGAEKDATGAIDPCAVISIV